MIMDDVFDENSDDEKRIMEMSRRRRENQLMTNSFREGAIVGQKKSWDTAFEVGYMAGFTRAYHLGREVGEEKVLNHLNTLTKERIRPETSLSDLCEICHPEKSKRVISTNQ